MDGSLLERQKIWTDPGRPGHKTFPYGIQGASISASHTGFRIVGPDILLDAGLRSREQPRAVVITHTHSDHCHEITKICMNSKETFNIWVPPEAVRPLQEHFAKYTGLRACSTKVLWNSSLFKGYIMPMVPEFGFRQLCQVYVESITPSKIFSEEIEVPDKSRKRKDREDNASAAVSAASAIAPTQKVRKMGKSRPRLIPDEHAGKLHPGTPAQHARFYIRGIRLKHSIPTMGYVIGEERKRLNDEFSKLQKEMSPKEFRTLLTDARKAKKEINVIKIVPILAFLCDCTSESANAAIERVCTEDEHPSIIMVECTFIDDADAKEAVSRKHVLWSKIAPTLSKYPDVTFLLIHFSQRYKDAGTLDAFAKTLPENVHAFY